MITKIDHVGIAVESLTEAVNYYEKAFGLKCSYVEEVPSQKVRVAFLEVGGVHIELLEPTSMKSPIAKFIEKRGQGVHHIAYGTDDIKQQLIEVKTAGCVLINETPVKGSGSKLVVFLHPKSTLGVLTELCSENDD